MSEKEELKLRKKVGYLNTREQNDEQVSREDALFYEQFPEKKERGDDQDQRTRVS